MTCSFLIPSRGRYDRLEHSIASIRANSKDSEILVRLDDCDPGAGAFAVAHPELRVIIGPRQIGELYGYGALHLMYDELAQDATGAWLWMWNDDCFLEVEEGVDWEAQLRSFYTPAIVHPQWHQLGGSGYQWDMRSAFPCVPSSQWSIEDWGEGMPEGWSSGMDGWLIHRGKSRGWKPQFLDGVTNNHQRDTPEQLIEHRK
jgi:hypothetical protein